MARMATMARIYTSGSCSGEGVMGVQGREVVEGEGFLGSRRRIFIDLEWATSKTMWKQ